MSFKKFADAEKIEALKVEQVKPEDDKKPKLSSVKP